jgi:DNA-cytosine methyltransferase
MSAQEKELKTMNVLSLFDGMSCAQIALNRIGVKLGKYYASELDKYAIKVTQANYPNTIQLGDVCSINPEKLDKIDLLVGGSPCQGFSFAGKQLAFEDPRSVLFFEYVRILERLKELNPNVKFLLENVRMKKEHLAVITKLLGVEPICINSSLVSAQNRVRYYWTNIEGIEQPEDRGILLKDIIQNEVDESFYHTEKAIAYMERGNDKWMQAGSRRSDGYTQSADKEKAFTVTANIHKGVPYNYFKCGSMIGRKINPVTGKRDDYNPSIKTEQRIEIREDDKTGTLTTVQKDNLVVQIALKLAIENELNSDESASRHRKLTPIECERLQTVDDNYTNHVSNTQRYRMLGNGFTVDVIAHILAGLKSVEMKIVVNG